MEQFWQYAIPALATVMVAVVEAIAARDRKTNKAEREKAVKEQAARDEKERKREQERAEESRLSMKMMSATLQLSVVTANALTGGHNNGNVERAKDAAADAEREYNAFLQRLAAAEIAKK